MARSRAASDYKSARFARRSSIGCHYCGRLLRRHEATVDHKIALSQGGRDNRTNMVLACESCNKSKGTTSAADYNAKAPWELPAKNLLDALTRKDGR